MITQEDLGDYKALHEKIENRANEILETYKKIRDEIFGESYPHYENGFSTEYYSANHVSFSSLDEQEIVYTGEEYWNYGGHESHTLRFPSWYLTCINFDEALRTKFRKEKGEIERQKELKVRLKEVEERAVLSKLQEKYKNE